MSAFRDGLVMLLDRGSGATFTLAFEEIHGVTGARTVYSAGGSGRGDLPGTWANVADRLGIAVAGGGGLQVADVAHPVNPYLKLTGSASTGSGNRGAIILPNADRVTTARVASTLVQPEVPVGWSALMARAPDNTVRLTVARWAGPGNCLLTLTDPRGAPVTSTPSIIRDTTAVGEWALHAPWSTAQIVRFLVETDTGMRACAPQEQHARLINNGSAPVQVRLTYVADDGHVQELTRLAAPGEHLVARIVNGMLSLSGPGTTTVGVYRPATREFHLRNSNTPGDADVIVVYGVVGDIPIVGDWDGQ